MEYTKLKFINQYKSESINPAKTPDTVFEMYSVPIYETGHPEFLRGDEIASNKAVVQKNDILLCKINPRINRVWVVSDESDKMNIASSEWIVIRNSEYNPEFLAWYFRTPKFQKLMTSEVTGIGGSLTRAQPKCVAEYPVPVLDRVKQDEIVAILNKCKFVIESRKQELDALDDLIKARFVELFGDPISNPKGWNMVELGELTSIGSSKRIFEKEYVSDGIPFYRTKEIVELSKGNSISTELYITEERFAEIKEKYGVPKTGDLLISAVGTIGVIWIVDGENDFYFKDGNLIRVDGSEKFDSIYMKNLLEHLIDEYKKQMSSGTAYAALTISGLTKMKVYDVPMELQRQFSEFYKQVDKSKVVVQKALDETQLLFDSLMQEYFG